MTFIREEVIELLRKLVDSSSPSTDQDELIYYTEYDNGDNYIDKDGYYLGKKFDKWCEENIPK